MKTQRYFHFTFMAILLLAVGLYFLPLGTASAQEPYPAGPSDDEVNAVAKQLYCPVCENIPLDVCPTQACAQWRALIREQLSEGWTETEIKDYFAAQYGDRVLAAPPARGLNWIIYVIPPLAIIAGVYILFRAMRSWREIPPKVEEQTLSENKIEDEYVARIEEELTKDRKFS
jgi:cytochrome c-type biogenesis protein CcmH